MRPPMPGRSGVRSGGVRDSDMREPRESDPRIVRWSVQWHPGGFSMPLRDHFRPPVKKLASWEGFHGMWPATMVQHLAPLLPQHYTAEPRAHLGSYVEI